MTDNKILFAIFIIAFICFIISAITVGIAMRKNPSMTDRQIILNYPVPTITELVSAITLTVLVIIAKQ